MQIDSYNSFQDLMIQWDQSEKNPNSTLLSFAKERFASNQPSPWHHHFIEFHACAFQAAKIGEAATTALRAIQRLAEKSEILTPTGESVQTVYLCPNEKVVFKKFNPLSEEEERNASAFFALNNGNVVSSYRIGLAALNNLNLSFSHEVLEQGIPYTQLPSDTRSLIKQCLKASDRTILKFYRSRYHPFDANSAEEKRAFEELKSYDVWMNKGGNDELIPFMQLVELYLKDELSANTKVGFFKESMKPLEEHMEKGTHLFQAINYATSPTKVFAELLCLPLFNNVNQQAAYKKCENYRWSFLEKDGKYYAVDFKNLRLKYLSMSNYQKERIHPVANPLFSEILTPAEWQIALSSSWRVASPHVIGLSEKDDQPEILSNCYAKVFVEDMLLMKQNWGVLDGIMERLTVDAQYNSVLTGECQLLDLHARNLGVKPITNAQFESFKGLSYKIKPSNESMDFNRLLTMFLTEELTESSIIEYSENGQHISKPLGELPDLMDALDVEWELVLFDLDLCIGTSNHWQYLIQANKQGSTRQHTIPLRSILLALSDTFLEDEVIESLLNSESRDQRTLAWMRRYDSPIYQRLASIKDEIFRDLWPFISIYQFTTENPCTISAFREHFIDNFSYYSIHNSEVWDKIERELAKYFRYEIIKENDTYESIAKRVGQNIKDLQELNVNKELISGEKVKIAYSLSGSTNFSRRLREEISAQLFPRVTIAQQEAFLERQKRRNRYLQAFLNFHDSTLQGQQLFDQVQSLIQLPEAPISTAMKKELQVDIGELDWNDPEQLKKIRDDIHDIFHPTYANLMRAMYPLLADVCELFEKAYPKERAEYLIGDIKYTVEKALTKCDDPELIDTMNNHLGEKHPAAFWGLKKEKRKNKVE